MNRPKRNIGDFGMHFRSPHQTLPSRQKSKQEDKQNSLYVDGDCRNAWLQNDRFEQHAHSNLPLSDISLPDKVPTTKYVLMGKKRILLVDDEEFVLSAEQKMIERYFDYKVTALTNSVEALEVFRAKPDHFDLVITDMIMPKMTGEVLAKQLIAVRSDVPVILCTGYSDCIIKNRAEEMGGAFLIKPFDLYEMGKAFLKVLHKE